MKHSEVALGNLSLHLHAPRVSVDRILYNKTYHINIMPSAGIKMPYITIVVQEDEIDQFVADIEREVLAASSIPLHDPEE